MISIARIRFSCYNQFKGLVIVDNRRNVLRFLYDVENINPRLRFLLKKYPDARIEMSYWLHIPEFSDKVLNIVENGEWITDEMVINIMESIYEAKKLESKEQKKSLGREIDFGFGSAKSAMRKIRKAIREKESASGGG